MLAGTGEGPLLAAKLLEHGWALRVSVVSAAAGRPYRALQAAAPLELQVGPLVGTAAMAAQLQQAVWQGEPFVAVIDATHPFATEVSRCLRQACLQHRGHLDAAAAAWRALASGWPCSRSSWRAQ